MTSPRKSLVTLLAISLMGLSVVSSRADDGAPAGATSSSEVNNIRESEYAADDTQHLHPLYQIVGMPINKTPGKASTVGAATPANITYRIGAPVMINPNIYVIWYGTWGTNPCSQTGNTTPAIVNDLLSNVGATNWYGINTRYYSQSSPTALKQYVTNVVRPSGCISDTASLGKANPSIAAIVDQALTSNALPRDTNGLYFVLTSSDVKVSGFLTGFCGYHSYFNPSYSTTSRIKFSFVGDATTSLGSCSGQTSVTSPNSNPAADAMTSVIAHELVETVSDPELNAWSDASGNENADKCAWTFGTTSTATNGSKYNLVAGTRQYFIQQNWNPDSPQACGMALPTPPPPAAPLSASVSVSSKNAMLSKAVTSFTPIVATGGVGTKKYSISPALPKGLTLNTNTGAISGTPTATLASTSVTVTVTDGASATASGSFMLQVSPLITATIAIPSPSFVHNVVTTAITPFTPITGGGSTYTPFVYTISPALPAGLTLNSSTGAISGNAPAAAAARKSYKVTITDASGFSGSASFNLTIS